VFLISAQAFAGEWIVDTESGCRLWNPISVSHNTLTVAYSGECNEGYAQGKGSHILYEEGKKIGYYEGDYIRGKSHGKGVYIWYDDRWLNKNKKIRYYEGEFKDGKPHGSGACTWYNNTWLNKNEKIGYYEGDFKEGKPHGKGQYTWYENGEKVRSALVQLNGMF